MRVLRFTVLCAALFFVAPGCGDNTADLTEEEQKEAQETTVDSTEEETEKELN